MLVAAESFRLRRAASRSRRISAASGSCGLSCPVFSKFSKVILGSYQKKLGLAGNARKESVTGLELGAHIPFGHHNGVDLASQPGLGRSQCLHHIGKSRVADHEHIHIAGTALLPLRNGAEHEREVDALPERRKGVAQDVRQSRRLSKNFRELRINRMVAISPVADLIADGLANE